MRLFTEIPVVPPRALYLNSSLADGGPIWPEFDTRGPVRFNRRVPVDRAPEPYDVKHVEIQRPCVWGGFIQRHFGHLIADHLTRVVESLDQRPDDLFLFITYPGGSVGDIPDYFWEVTGWYGLPPDQIALITQPTLVAELRCAPQAEHLFGRGPSARYLRLLERNAARNRLLPVASAALYVARTGLLAQGKGGHAGEAYLVTRLQELGVTILDPAHSPLLQQLARYAGAKTLIFAEGSALHGRQLLGWAAQTILVLKRRKGHMLGIETLLPRCTRLGHVEAVADFAEPLSADGQILPAHGISFYDLDALFAGFQDVGIDLKSVWSQPDYLKARDADVGEWLAYSGRYGRLSVRSVAALTETFTRLGLERLLGGPIWQRINWRVRAIALAVVLKLVRKRKPWTR